MDNHTPTSEAKPTFRTAEEYERAIYQQKIAAHQQEYQKAIAERDKAWQELKDSRPIQSISAFLLCSISCWMMLTEGLTDTSILLLIAGILLGSVGKK